MGYEHSIPILRQIRDHKGQEISESILNVVENLHNTPDFLLVLPDKTQAYLVEVKYRREAKPQEIIRMAETIHARWHPVQLFLATLQGFYFDTCERILEKAAIPTLAENLIPKETQTYYLNLLRRFEK